MMLPNQSEPVQRTTGSSAFVGNGIVPQSQCDWQFKCHRGLVTVKNPNGEALGGTGASLPYACNDYQDPTKYSKAERDAHKDFKKPKKRIKLQSGGDGKTTGA